MPYLNKDFKGSVNSSFTTSQRDPLGGHRILSNKIYKEEKKMSSVGSLWDIARTAGLSLRERKYK